MPLRQLRSREKRGTRHRTQVRIRRNQTSETKFGTNCPKSEPNAVAYVSFLYTKQTTFRGWASLSIARAGVSPPAHTGPGRTRRADDAHEKARVIPDQCGTRLPRRADGATRRRRPGASIPWAAAPHGAARPQRRTTLLSRKELLAPPRGNTVNLGTPGGH